MRWSRSSAHDFESSSSSQSSSSARQGGGVVQPLFSSIGPTLPFSFGSFVPRFGLSQRLVHCPSKPFETPLYQAFSAAAVGSFLQSSYVVQSQYCVAGSHSPAF